jgi:hypothetical protein
LGGSKAATKISGSRTNTAPILDARAGEQKDPAAFAKFRGEVDAKLLVARFSADPFIPVEASD